MPEPIRADFRWTANELLAGTRAHYCARFPLPVRILYFAAGTLTFLIGVVQTIQFGPRALLPLVAGLIILTQYTVIMPLTLRAQFKRRPDSDSAVSWHFAPEQIETESGPNRARFEWSAFQKVVRVKGGLLFYPTSSIFHWIPRHAFANEAEFEQVAALAAGKARKFLRKG